MEQSDQGLHCLPFHLHPLEAFFIVKASIIIYAVRKPAFCICENKDADQLRGDRKADQRLCFLYMDRTNSLLPKYEISSLQSSSVVVQPGLCQT